MDYPTLWPDLQVPDRVMAHARMLALSGKVAAGSRDVEYLGRGAYNTAYTSSDWVIKISRTGGGGQGACGTEWRDLMDYVLTLSQDWIDLFSMILSPTVVVAEHVIIQKRVVGTCKQIFKENFSIESLVESVAIRLGMYDVHSSNWGLDETGSIRIFDPMFAGQYPFMTADRRLDIHEMAAVKGADKLHPIIELAYGITEWEKANAFRPKL